MVLKACENAKRSSTEAEGSTGSQEQNGGSGGSKVNGDTSQTTNGHPVNATPPKKVGLQFFDLLNISKLRKRDKWVVLPLIVCITYIMY